MIKFEITKLFIEGLNIVKPHRFGDERGFFEEFYNKKAFEDSGLTADFVQDNHSKSRKDVLRGLHFQKKAPQLKLVRVLRGSIYDVAVDLRKGSPTYGKWHGEILTFENGKMLWIPEGFAHGFLTLENDTEVLYKCSNLYNPEDEGGIIWNDIDIKINWGIENPLISEKDKKHPAFKDFDSPFVYKDSK